MSDGQLRSALPPFSIEVIEPLNSSPTIRAETFNLVLGARLQAVPVVSDADGDPLRLLLFRPPDFGTLQHSDLSFTYVAPATLPATAVNDKFSLMVTDDNFTSEPVVFTVNLSRPGELITSEIFVQQAVTEQIYFLDALRNIPQNLGDTYELAAVFSPFGWTQIIQGSVRLEVLEGNNGVFPVSLVIVNSSGRYFPAQAVLVVE